MTKSYQAEVPVFPQDISTLEYDNPSLRGMTKREYYAVMAMQGILGNSNPDDIHIIARKSVALADELLEELEK